MKPFEQVLSLCGRIPPDKLAHALGGATFTAFACPALYYLGDPTYLLTSLLAVMCVGLFKEVYDALFRAKHSVELWDALATLCGGLMPLMPIVLIR